MAGRLDNASLNRLIKLCGMFGSAHEGERSNAAAMADQLIRSKGLRWGDVLLNDADSAKAAEPDDDITLAENNLQFLTLWERDFVNSLRAYTILSNKQQVV